MLRRVMAVGCASALILSACVGEADDDTDDFDEVQEAESFDDDGELDDDEFQDDDFEESEPESNFGDDDDVDALLEELSDEGFCDPADVDDLGTVTAMHFVVRGQIQQPCYVDGGVENDPRLLDAWESLTSITPNDLVDDVSLLAGFEPCSDCDTLAFVSALDEGSSFFLMAVDVVSGDDDPEELLLTMQHELTHVFNQEPGVQLDLDADPEECPTYHNGTGCFTDDSYMAAWIEQFWPDELLAALPDDGAPNDDDTAAATCDANPDFVGSYAATHPEEDFAETFSAYVFSVDVSAALDTKLAFFDDYPEFVEIKNNATAAGLTGLPNNFDGCG